MTSNDKDPNSGRFLPITIALIGLLGTLGAALITNWDKIFSENDKAVTSSAPPLPQIADEQRRSDSSSSPSALAKNGEESTQPYSEPEKIIGTWKFDGVEFGQQFTAFWQILPGGFSLFKILTPSGAIENSGTWQYSNGIIFENYSNGSVIRDSIRWLSNDHFELTILDNGNPAYAGLKRDYYRQVH